jgi:hypothetical protein
VVPEPQNHHLNKDGTSASCDSQYQILNIKRLRNLYLAVLLLVHFQAKDILVVRIVHLNLSIGNYIIHDLVSTVVKDVKCVRLVVALHGQSEA